MKGKIYGVGVGPGDPELMTLKAVRLIRDHRVIAVPGREAKNSLAYRIAVQAVPELADKVLLPVYMPMVHDRKKLAKAHREGASLLEKYLDEGESIVYLTLGDPAVYCSFSFLQHILEADGYKVELVSGVTSFCAAAARLGISLAEWDEPLYIVPAVHQYADLKDEKANYVFMKLAGRMWEIREMLGQSGLSACGVSDCGMEAERIYRSVEEIPDQASYFSLLIAKRGQ